MPLFAFGSNGSGQLGIGHDEDISIPTECLFDEQTSSQGDASNVSRIVAGGNHTILLYEDGAVYAAGCNEDGRCAHSPAAPLLRFKRVIVKENAGPGAGSLGQSYEAFRDVAATWEASFLVARSEGLSGHADRVFAVGSGAKGELGLGEEYRRVVGPVVIPNFPPHGTEVVAIAGGMGHVVAVLSNGEVWGWGGARKGQLGDAAKAMKIAWSPVKIEGVPFHATGAACGREFTVIAGDQAAGEFVIMGACDNKWDILSGAAAASQSVTSYRNIAANWHGVYVHQNDFSIIAWGRNDRGQLPPLELPRPQQLGVGSEHVLALLDDRTVVAFGWGEHGNCGPAIDTQGNVKGVYKQIPLELKGEDVKIVGIGAGCATSWIITS